MREPVRLEKVTRPAGVFSSDMEALVSDEYGEWLFAPAGSRWDAPHESGEYAFDVLVLLCPDPVSVTWWHDEQGLAPSGWTSASHLNGHRMGGASSI